MAVYAIAIIPMILMIVDITSKIDDSTKTAAYADNVTAAGKIIHLKNWWKTLCILGSKFPKASKSWLIVKEKAKQRAFTVFKDTAIKIITEGQRHLRAVIGSSKYKREYFQNKTDVLINEIKTLPMIAKAEPQATYSCFITAFKHQPSYIMRTIPDITHQLNQRDQLITSEFIPAITGGIHCSDIKRKLVSLPSKFGRGGGGAYNFNLCRNFKLRIWILLDVIKRSFCENNETRNSTVIWNWCTKYQTKNEKPKTAKTSSKVREH